ncbi:MAG: tetratricopeptide repeat protein [Treponema sp.]|jgi:tetratricopeptide (TPR) repeat protein|nr:tetratricopeptide repeat protein [Treponema sp.]
MKTVKKFNREGHEGKKRERNGERAAIYSPVRFVLPAFAFSFLFFICCLASGCRAKSPLPDTPPAGAARPEAEAETVKAAPEKSAPADIAANGGAVSGYQTQRSLNDFSGALPAFGVHIAELNPVNYRKSDPALLEQMGMEPYLVSFIMGEQRYRAGDYDRAIAEYNRSVSLNANFSDALVSRGNAWLKKGDTRRAIEDYTRALTLQNRRPEVYNYRGYARAEQGETVRAIADFSRALALKADYADALINRAHALYETGDYDRAIEDCTRVIALEPENAAVWNRRGSAWYGKEDDERAIADFSRALKIKPDYALAWHNRGNAWYNKGDYAKALADLNRALALDPSFTGAHTSRENVLRKMGKRQEEM